MENQQHMQENEIDIKEYINVIIKRKKLILVIFLISVFIAVIVSLKIPKIYEITSTVQLGSINGLLIKTEEAKAIMLNQNLLLSIIDELGLKTVLDDFQKDINISGLIDTNLLKIKITYPDIDLAIKINDAIVKPLIVQGQTIYQKRLSIINERLKELDSEINNAEEDIGRTQALISGVPSANNISQSDVSLRIILLQNTLPNYESNLTMLRSQRNDLKLLFYNAKDFEIFDAPIKPDFPVGPKKKQIVFKVGIFSLMFGIFLAFVLEFWQKNKKQKR